MISMYEPGETDIEKKKEALLRIKDATLAIIAEALLPIPGIAGFLKLSMMLAPIATIPIYERIRGLRSGK